MKAINYLQCFGVFDMCRRNFDRSIEYGNIAAGIRYTDSDSADDDRCLCTLIRAAGAEYSSHVQVPKWSTSIKEYHLPDKVDRQSVALLSPYEQPFFCPVFHRLLQRPPIEGSATVELILQVNRPVLTCLVGKAIFLTGSAPFRYYRFIECDWPSATTAPSYRLYTTRTSTTIIQYPIPSSSFENSSRHNHHAEEIPSAIDILMIDTEGHDALVIRGAKHLLKRHAIRCLVFEYHELFPWSEMKLEETGAERLWPVSGSCWHENYEFHSWSNVMCVLREDPWRTVIQKLPKSRSVYLIENGQKRPFRSGKSFVAAGYIFDNVKNIKDLTVFNLFPAGTPV
eukprot:gene34063-44011_t